MQRIALDYYGVRRAGEIDSEWMLAVDKAFYGDGFFTIHDFLDMIRGNRDTDCYVTLRRDAFILIFTMPNNAVYITSLAGSREGRLRCLRCAMQLYSSQQHNRRMYTHGSPKWYLQLLV